MIEETADNARAARAAAPPPGAPQYDAYCAELAHRLTKGWADIAAANDADVARAEQRGLPASLVDRLRLDRDHLGSLVTLTDRVRQALPAVTGAGPARTVGGMAVRRLAKPIGTLLMIYEARPTVTVEGALLPVAVGNTVVLRGGSEMVDTNRALGVLIGQALVGAGLPAGMVQVVAETDRSVIRGLLRRHDVFDVLIPRGSPSLIDYCQGAATMPVIASGGGVNHLYVHADAEPATAAAVALDSKLTEPTACNTLEMVLVHRSTAEAFVGALIRHGARLTYPYGLRLDPVLVPAATRAAHGLAGAAVSLAPLEEYDDGREFLDRTLGVRVVDGVDEAVGHIRRHGSRHTEGVTAADPEVIERFCRGVDAAALVVNGSLRLHDGPTMGLGPELSISTGRLHVRGPVGLDALVTYSWLIEGDGTLRGAATEVGDD